ncbi:MAG: putative secreted protein [Motiliproteus sp.]|jgi:predicted secreted protein
MRPLLIPAMLLMLVTSLPTYAAGINSSLNYNLYQLSASAEDEIDNDLMKVTLTASHQALQTFEASNVVNSQMAEALGILKTTKNVQYQTGNYHTQPVYQNQQIVGWKASQNLELKSADVNQLSDILGVLQKELKISSINFDISQAVRKKVENLLSIEVLNRFKERAALVQETMGAVRYKVVSLNLNSGSQRPSFGRTLMRSEMASVSSAPAIESGKGTINVEVSGQIQLIFN